MRLYEIYFLIVSIELFYSKRNNSTIRLHRLELQGFRNYGQLQLELTEKRSLIIGPNGIGKSNLLEAVEILGSLRSHRSSSDGDLINWNLNQALIRATVNDREIIELQLKRIDDPDG